MGISPIVSTAMKINDLKRLATVRQNLGELDEIWTGWSLRNGQLFDPQSNAVTGFKPTDVRVIFLLRQQISALESELKARPSRRTSPSPRLTQLEALQHAITHLEAEIRSKGTDDELEALRHPERGPRQLSTLARTTQAPGADRRIGIDRRAGTRLPLAPPFSVTWQAGSPRPVKAIPPATRSDRK